MADLFATIDRFTGLSCRWQAAVSQELNYHRGVASTNAPPLNENGIELIPTLSPERTANVSTEPAPQQQQHPVLEPAIPHPLPGLQLVQPPLVVADGGLPHDDGLAPQQTECTDEPMPQDPKRKAPFDEDGFQRVMAVAKAGTAKGEGKGCPEQAANKRKTDA